MASSLVNILGITLFPLGAAIVGGVGAAFRQPNRRQQSYVQHFAAGAVFAATTSELLPTIETRAPSTVLIGFTFGIGLMLTLKTVSARSEDELGDEWAGGVVGAGLMLIVNTFSRQIEEELGDGWVGGALGLLTIIGVDVTIDGLLIGITFATETGGILLTVALSVELLFLGISIVASMSETASRSAAIVATTGVGVLLPIGAVVGLILLSGATRTIQTGFLAFGSIALLYLVTEELLADAHDAFESSGAAGAFFGGFGLLFILEMIS